MTTSPLSGQVAIITGGSSGIGVGVAEELHAAGMNLVLTARREDRLRDVAARLGSAKILVGDITDPRMPQELIDFTLEQFGRCDVVFNGAGIMHVGEVGQVNIEDLCRMVRVNVEAATRVAYSALTHFRSIGAGHLVNVSSILGTKVRPTAGVYAGTKYAIEALSEALRMELAKTDIKVSVIEPGVVVSELQDHFPVHPRQAQGITRPLLASDIGRCVRFILEQPPHVRIPRIMILPGEQSM